MLRFELIPKSARKRKLPSWYIFNETDCLPIGEIVWKFVWRCYIFEPYPDTQWNDECLDEVSNFLKLQKREKQK